jgi:hypothetical protein
MPKLYVFQPPAAGSSILSLQIYPNADGGVISIPWSADVHPASQGGWETSSGGASAGYNYTHFDALINNQLSYGAKSIVVVLSPIDFGGSNNSTPQYVFTAAWATSISATRLYTAAASDYLGSGAITPPGSAQGVDNTAFPAAWMPAFQTAWISAVQNALNHMAAQSYASKIAYVRVGGGAGGEWFPWATAGLLTVPGGPGSIAALQTTWVGYMSAVESAILATSSGFKFVQAVDGGFATESVPYSYADAEASTANGNGFGIGCEGLKGNDIGAYSTHLNTSGGAATSGFPSMDHAYLFSTYPAAPLLQFQTSAASDPTGITQPGSLVPLLPYAIARGSNAIELYYQDWQVAYDPSNPSNATYGIPYQTAIQSARGTSVGSGPTGYSTSGSTKAKPGYGSKLFMSTTNSNFTPVAQLQRFAPSTVSKQTEVDRTNVLTPDNFARPFPVRVDSGDLELVGILDPANTQILQLGQAHAALTLCYFMIVLTDGTQYTFQGYVSEYSPFSVSYNKAIGFSAKIRVAGGFTGPMGSA